MKTKETSPTSLLPAQKKIIIFALFFIIFVGAILRFVNYENRLNLTGDATRDALVAKVGARELQFPLTGSFSSIGPITFGPWYYYQLILAEIILPTPLAPWLSIGILSLLVIPAMFRIGQLLLNWQFGFLLALIAAVSPAQIGTSSALTHHQLVGIFASLAIWLFLEIFVKQKGVWYGLFLGLVVGLAINAHYQALGLLTLLALLLFLGKKSFKILTFSLLGLFITFLPLLFFELNNHWFNLRNWIYYLRFGQYQVWLPTRWLTFTFDFFPRLWTWVVGGPKELGFSLMAGFALLSVYSFWKKKFPQALYLITLSFLIQVLMVRYWRGDKFFGYVQFFHPYLFIFTGYVLSVFFKTRLKWLLGVCGLIVYLGLTAPSIKKVITPADSVTLEIRQKFQVLKNTPDDQKFAYYSCLVDDINAPQAFALLLDMEGKFSPDGTKIGQAVSNCIYPNIIKMGGVISQEETKNYLDLFPKIGSFAVFDEATHEALLKRRWRLHSPQVVHQDVTRWWFKEQP